MGSFNQDFKEFFALLNAKRVEYLLVGGAAFNYHAPPRATKDIDIWVHAAPDNLDRLLEAIRLDPRSADALLNRGRVRLQEGRVQDAAADFTEALRVGPAEWALSEQAKMALESCENDEF